MRLTAAEIDELLSTRPVHRNTLQNSEVVFLRTSAETGGEYTLLHTRAEPGSGITRHYHQTYSERFDVLEGVLSVEIDGRTQVLAAGDSCDVPRKAVHRWVNQSTSPVRFLIEAAPASEGLEKGTQILYGLASDGLTLSNGLPRNPMQAAWLMEYSDMLLPGAARSLSSMQRMAADRARTKGVDQQLLGRYCR
jgi:quercetin dioxygenase-like cupin family protein